MTNQKTNRIRTFFALTVVVFVAGTAWGDTYTVTNTSDSGSGSLRQAITSANDSVGVVDVVAFNILGTGPHTIQLSSALPEIGDSVIIDGYTQDGASAATAATSAVLQIVLDGTNLTNMAGLWILPRAPYCIVRGLQIQGFQSAIVVAGDYNAVEGNHIFGCRLDAIFIDGDFNTIGGPTSAQRNVVAGNHNGIGASTTSSHNTIQGNYVGTDPRGRFARTTDGKDGVALGGSYNTVVDNLISGYEHQGILIMRWGNDYPIPEYNVIERNKIGTNVDGTSSIPNGNGITINSARFNTIAGNLISGNKYHGIVVTNDFLPLLTTGNRITANSIFDNSEIGINLYDRDLHDWVTPNDPGDTDDGPNHLMNFPVLSSARATPGQLVVMGTIDTPNPMSVRLEFFANSTADSSGYGEGEIYLGDAKPNATGAFTAALPTVLPPMWISATATDRDGNTSEFALSIESLQSGKP